MDKSRTYLGLDGGATKMMVQSIQVSDQCDFACYDKYNYDTGKFTSMSKESAKQYMEDINTFYKIFTQDTKDKPNEIKNFSDIKLKDYSKSKL